MILLLLIIVKLFGILPLSWGWVFAIGLVAVFFER